MKESRGGWTMVPVDGLGVHVIPVDDLQDHMDEDCPCNPVCDLTLAGAWMHNSFDGREAFEEGERKVS